MRNAEFETLTYTHLASEPVLGFISAALDSELEERGRTRRVDEAPTLRRAEALAANPTLGLIVPAASLERVKVEHKLGPGLAMHEAIHSGDPTRHDLPQSHAE